MRRLVKAITVWWVKSKCLSHYNSYNNLRYRFLTGLSELTEERTATLVRYHKERFNKGLDKLKALGEVVPDDRL